MSKQTLTWLQSEVEKLGKKMDRFVVCDETLEKNARQLDKIEALVDELSRRVQIEKENLKKEGVELSDD